MKVESTNIEFDDNNILISLFGANDSNIRILEKINEVVIQQFNTTQDPPF